MVADLSLFDLFAAVIAHDECVKGLLMGLEGVLAPVHRATLLALVDLVGVTLSLVKPVNHKSIFVKKLIVFRVSGFNSENFEINLQDV